MPGAQITVAFKGDSIAAGFRALQKLGRDPATLMRPIGAALVETTLHRFETATDPQGKAWQPWSPAYAKVTTSNSILRGRGGAGGLMQSITSAVDGRSVRVGSNKIYAGVHQFGATIVPKVAKALVFMLGDRKVVVKKVTIPARPYLGFGPADRLAVLGVVRAELMQALAARRGG
jgi:phage virion morphogenesis protein